MATSIALPQAWPRDQRPGIHPLCVPAGHGPLPAIVLGLAVRPAKHVVRHMDQPITTIEIVRGLSSGSTQ